MFLNVKIELFIVQKVHFVEKAVFHRKNTIKNRVKSLAMPLSSGKKSRR